MTDEAGRRDELEARACTCGADGSGESHEEWCLWHIVEHMFNTLGACERYARRIAGHDIGHSLDRENAKAIIRVAQSGRNENPF